MTNIISIRKFLIYQRDQVLPQLQSNKEFSRAISDYIVKTKPSEVSGDAFVLLGCLYSNSTFKEVCIELPSFIIGDFKRIRNQPFRWAKVYSRGRGIKLNSLNYHSNKLRTREERKPGYYDI